MCLLQLYSHISTLTFFVAELFPQADCNSVERDLSLVLGNSKSYPLLSLTTFFTMMPACFTCAVLLLCQS